MTSSLVGSEMCIRDSNITTIIFSNNGNNLKEQIATSQHCRQTTTTTTTVSYTHLTLPTICSV
eukprot:9719950-Prorocentrum_lima.AAC.1